MERHKYIIYVALSADGYIADKDGGVGWLHDYPASAFGLDGFLARIGTIVMGRVAFNQALPVGGRFYEDKRVIVLTSKALPKDLPENVEPWRDGLPALKTELDRAPYPVWIAGGARTIRSALGHGLAHQMDLHIVPRLLGEGMPLFLPGSRPAQLKLAEAAQLSRDIVHLKYDIL